MCDDYDDDDDDIIDSDPFNEFKEEQKEDRMFTSDNYGNWWWYVGAGLGVVFAIIMLRERR
jgi:hypothetical protein